MFMNSEIYQIYSHRSDFTPKQGFVQATQTQTCRVRESLLLLQPGDAESNGVVMSTKPETVKVAANTCSQSYLLYKA